MAGAVPVAPPEMTRKLAPAVIAAEYATPCPLAETAICCEGAVPPWGRVYERPVGFAVSAAGGGGGGADELVAVMVNVALAFSPQGDLAFRVKVDAPAVVAVPAIEYELSDACDSVNPAGRVPLARVILEICENGVMHPPLVCSS